MTVKNPSTSAVPGLVRRGAVLGLVAVVVNLLVLLAGRVAGASFAVAGPGGAPTEVGIGAVLIATVAGLAVGLAAAALLLARRAVRGVRVLQIVGGVFAVLSVISPALADTDVVTRVALSVMHLVVGAAYVAALDPFAHAPARQPVD